MVTNYINDGKLKYKGFTSAFVRILDGQKEGELNEKINIDALQYKYLPKDKNLLTKFAYNQQKRDRLNKKDTVKKYIPNNGLPLNFNKAIVNKAIEQFEIKNYNFELI